MDLEKKLLTLLAIFCIIASASVVCAADQDGYAGINYQNMNGVSGSQYETSLEPGAGLPLENQTAPEPGAGLPLENQTEHVPVNNTSNATGNTTGNVTSNVTTNTTNTTPVVANTTDNTTTNHAMLATGNPVLLVLGASALLGGYAILRRND